MANNSWLSDWNKFHLNWIGLMARLEHGEMRLVAKDVYTLRQANEYFTALDTEADIPDIMRIYTEHRMP